MPKCPAADVRHYKQSECYAWKGLSDFETAQNDSVKYICGTNAIIASGSLTLTG